MLNSSMLRIHRHEEENYQSHFFTCAAFVQFWKHFIFRCVVTSFVIRKWCNWAVKSRILLSDSFDVLVSGLDTRPQWIWTTSMNEMNRPHKSTFESFFVQRIVSTLFCAHNESNGVFFYQFTDLLPVKTVHWPTWAFRFPWLFPDELFEFLRLLFAFYKVRTNFISTENHLIRTTYFSWLLKGKTIIFYAAVVQKTKFCW